eukprot:2373770-Amphidinium_carterae.1
MQRALRKKSGGDYRFRTDLKLCKENMRYRRNQVGGATTSTISTIAYPRNAGATPCLLGKEPLRQRPHQALSTSRVRGYFFACSFLAPTGKEGHSL